MIVWQHDSTASMGKVARDCRYLEQWAKREITTKVLIVLLEDKCNALILSNNEEEIESYLGTLGYVR